MINVINNKVYEFDKNSIKPIIKEQKSEEKGTVNDIVQKTNLNQEDLMGLDDNKIEELFKRVKLDEKVKIADYNELGIRKENINDEVLKYITNKEFKEGIDEFIPSRVIPANVYDIDIKPEEMDQEHKDLFDAIEEKYEGYEEIEDNFILMANDGKLPIIIDENNKESETKIENVLEDEVVLINENKEKKKMKHITEEEREFLNKKFNNVFEKEYKTLEEKKISCKNEKIPEKILNEAISELIGKKRK